MESGGRIEPGQDETTEVSGGVRLRTVGVRKTGHREEIKVIRGVHRIERTRILHAAIGGRIEGGAALGADLARHRLRAGIGEVRIQVTIGREDFGGLLADLGVSREGRGLQKALRNGLHAGAAIILRDAIIGKAEAEGEGAEGAGRHRGVGQALLERGGGVLAVELLELSGARADEAETDRRVFIIGRKIVVVDAIASRAETIDTFDDPITEQTGARRRARQDHLPAGTSARDIARRKVIGASDAPYGNSIKNTIVHREDTCLTRVQSDLGAAADTQSHAAREIAADVLGDVVAGAVGAPDGDRQGLPLTIGIEAGDGETDVERIP